MSKIYSPVKSKGAIAGGLIIGGILVIPFLLSAYLIFLGPAIFSFSLFLLLLSILAFMGYMIYSGVNMRYIIGDEVLTLKIGFHERKIIYSYIKDIRPEKLSLIRLRIFGASWPGFLWGIFSAVGLGTVHLYCTKWRGEFVLIELLNGEKIGITPEQQVQFIDEVYLQIVLVIVAYIALIAYVFYVYPILPALIPVHFDLYGNPNSWASKSELYDILLLATIFPILNSLLTLKFGKYDKMIVFFLGITFLLTTLIFFGIVAWIVKVSI